MSFPSITVVLSTIFTVYVVYSIYTLSQLFITLKCTSTPCYRTILATNPKLQLNLFTSIVNNPLTKDVTKVAVINNFQYRKNDEQWVFRFHSTQSPVNWWFIEFDSQTIGHRYTGRNTRKWHHVPAHCAGEWPRTVWVATSQAWRDHRCSTHCAHRIHDAQSGHI